MTRGQDLRVTILHTSDWHSRLIPYDIPDTQLNDEHLGLIAEDGPFGGAARFGTLLKCSRIKPGQPIPQSCQQLETMPAFQGITGSERHLWFDSGDIFQGAPIFNIFSGEPEIKIMSELKLDGAVVGNHEFDKGAENYAVMLERYARFPALAANYYFADSRVPGANRLERLIQPYAIYNLQGLRVGVIGMGNFSSMYSILRGGNSLGIIPLNPYQVLQDYIDFLRPQVDLLVALSHMGLKGEDNLNPEDEENIRHTCGLDLVLGGHLHIVLTPPQQHLECTRPFCRCFADMEAGRRERRRVILQHPGAFLKFAARLDLVVRDQRIVSYRQKIFPLNRFVPEDRYINQMLEPYVFEVSRQVDLTRVIGWADRRINRFHGAGGDSPLGNLVCEAMQKRRRVETDFCLNGTLGIRDNFPQGALTQEQLFNSLPFENSIVTLFLSGFEIQEVLNYVAVRSWERGCNSQAQVSGLTFVLNCAANPPRAERITVGGSGIPCQGDEPVSRDVFCRQSGDGRPGGEICNGDRCWKPIVTNASYSMATNSYLAQGGSGFLTLERNRTQFDTGLPMRQAVADYIQQKFQKCKQCCFLEKRVQCFDLNAQLPAGCPAVAVPCMRSASDDRIRVITGSTGGSGGP